MPAVPELAWLLLACCTFNLPQRSPRANTTPYHTMSYLKQARIQHLDRISPRTTFVGPLSLVRPWLMSDAPRRLGEFLCLYC